MSIDRCSRCGDLVDTDNEPEAYVETKDASGAISTLCLCRNHREEFEEAQEGGAS